MFEFNFNFYLYFHTKLDYILFNINTYIKWPRVVSEDYNILYVKFPADCPFLLINRKGRKRGFSAYGDL